MFGEFEKNYNVINKPPKRAVLLFFDAFCVFAGCFAKLIFKVAVEGADRSVAAFQRAVCDALICIFE